ncbi:MAG: phytanoyl-CoA dioxygenase family protein [Planctomycetota bacterium]|nr:phytanoyl-CoA dioxygenase family protein [Planctomycetota bacterium]MDA1138798.1 phytanoyl-CoA dioxygenase family protein [Planctomycetota bacterium]
MNDSKQIQAQFDELGYILVPDALNADQVKAINEAFDSDLQQNDWPLKRGDGHLQDANILLRLPALDISVESPAVMPIVTALMGEVATFDEYSAMIRNPTDEIPEKPAWHRDFKRTEEFPFGIYALSLVYYLSDVSESDHCFAVVPRSHNRDINVEAGKHGEENEVDILGPAGTAVFFHTALLHTARLRRGSRQRRTIHIYYGHADTPQISSYTDVPERLRNKVDPLLPAKFYSKRRATA